VLWLTVVVAFAVLWQMEIRQRNLENPPNLRLENIRLHEELLQAQTTLKWSRVQIIRLQDRPAGKMQPP
jgi:hypothetical protein